MRKTSLFAFLAISALSLLFASCDKSDDPEANGGVKEGAGEAIDLGLPSGTLWADRNIGASSESDFGSYFAWGETEPKTFYSWANYKYDASGNTGNNSIYHTLSKYNSDDGKLTLDLSDDAARVNWGGKWQMPTTEQFEELINYCIATWVKDYNGLGVAGYYVVGPSKNGIFLPAAGSYDDGDLSYVGKFGNYWSADLSQKNMTWTDSHYASCANYMVFYYGLDVNNGLCCRGFSVRPVCSSEN